MQDKWFGATLSNEQLQRAVMFGEWISVKDRLPDLGGDEPFGNPYYLATDGKDVYFGQYYDEHSYDTNPLWRLNVWVMDSEITHWMHLPRPPKSE